MRIRDMRRFEEYVARAREYLRMPDAEVRDINERVTLVIAGVRELTREVPASTLRLPSPFVVPEGSVFYDHVLLFDETSIRSHQETDLEAVRNICDVRVRYRKAWKLRSAGIDTTGGHDLEPGDVIYSVQGMEGHNHGFTTFGNLGMVYVAKALKPDFRDGRYFRMPENTYNGSQ